MKTALPLLRGKKLLILGGSAYEIPLVRRAQALGVYVVVADSNKDYALSPAKIIANAALDISWSDIDELEIVCREMEIDGATAGYSEIRVENLIKLCDRLSLPCFITEDQLEITRNKDSFKRECEKCGVPTVFEYSPQAKKMEYPVIVKPVDRGGSIGISIANNDEEFKEALTYGKRSSLSGRVIVEKYITDQTKVDSFYAVVDGVAYYLGMSDTVLSRKNGVDRVVQDGWFIPSRFESSYLEKIDAPIRRMISDMEIRNGFLFFSGFVDSSGEFVFFEMGFRLSAGELFEFFSAQGKPNVLDLFIEHALTGNCRNCLADTRPDDEGCKKCAVVNYYLDGGNVSQITGFDKVADLPDCRLALLYCYPGLRADSDKAILPKAAMFHFYGEAAEHLRCCIKKANSTFRVEDKNGRSLLYSRIEPSDFFAEKRVRNE